MEVTGIFLSMSSSKYKEELRIMCVKHKFLETTRNRQK